MDSTTTQKCTVNDAVMLADVHLMAAQAALDKMFRQGYLSICDIDNILEMTGQIPDRTCYQILHTIHCVHYSDMAETLRNGIPMLIGAVLKMEGLNYVRFKP
jgi:hypothetical protein